MADSDKRINFLCDDATSDAQLDLVTFVKKNRIKVNGRQASGTTIVSAMLHYANAIPREQFADILLRYGSRQESGNPEAEPMEDKTSREKSRHRRDVEQ